MKKYNKSIANNDKLELIHVSGDRNMKKALAWSKKEKLPWPHVLNSDISKTMVKNIKFRGYPTYVLIDKNGKEIIRGHGSGPVLKKALSLAK